MDLCISWGRFFFLPCPRCRSRRSWTCSRTGLGSRVNPMNPGIIASIGPLASTFITVTAFDTPTTWQLAITFLASHGTFRTCLTFFGHAGLDSFVQRTNGLTLYQLIRTMRYEYLVWKCGGKVGDCTKLERTRSRQTRSLSEIGSWRQAIKLVTAGNLLHHKLLEYHSTRSITHVSRSISGAGFLRHLKNGTVFLLTKQAWGKGYCTYLLSWLPWLLNAGVFHDQPTIVPREQHLLSSCD